MNYTKDFRQSQPFSKYLAASGWKTARLSDGTYIYIFKLPLLGTFIRIPRPKPNIPFEELDQIAKKYHAIFIKLEPNSTAHDSFAKEHGYTFDSWSIEPTKTLVINLTHSEHKLFSDLKPKWRQYVRLSKKNGVQIRESDDIDTFIKLWQQNASRKKFPIEKLSALKVLWQEFKAKKKANLLLAVVNNQPIAASFLIFSDQTCHLWHLAYSGDYPHLKPLYLLVWESIIFAKKRGYKYFDFEGIEDPRLPYTKKVQPTYFKKGFGGKEIQLTGSYVKYLHPIYKPFFSLIAKISPTLFLPLYRMISKFTGFHPDNWSIEPTTTLIIDLTKSEKELFSHLHKRAKNNLKIAQKQGVEIVHSENIAKFNKLWQKNASKKGFLVESLEKTSLLWQEFKKRDRADLLFAQVKKRVVAGIFLINWGKTTHLWHLAYTGEYSRLQPLYLLMWQSILFAKKRGSKYFDFEGIEDPRLPYTKNLQSSYFKKGFGGKQVQLALSYVKYVKPIYSLPFYLLGKLKPNLFRTIYKKYA